MCCGVQKESPAERVVSVGKPGETQEENAERIRRVRCNPICFPDTFQDHPYQNFKCPSFSITLPILIASPVSVRKRRMQSVPAGRVANQLPCYANFFLNSEQGTDSHLVVVAKSAEHVCWLRYITITQPISTPFFDTQVSI